MKSRGVDSPNIADALCLTEHFSNSVIRAFAKDKDPYGLKRNYRNTFSFSAKLDGVMAEDWTNVVL